ncbi:MAG: hypothetical protein CVU99_02360 [Firmicutes bacterium HGW-Firmicutes-4]|jgi:sugar lactone lactonase YvrE|nr:MAG: hypothetical protein CVU99_02360 [Firmicutes bacterium HGW-Firmicutes-4]
MAKATWIKVSGTWKKVKNVWEKVGGVWKQKVKPSLNIASTWKECIQYNTMYTTNYDSTLSTGTLYKRDLNHNVLGSVNFSGYADLMEVDKDGHVFMLVSNGTARIIQHYTPDLALVSQKTLVASAPHTDMCITKNGTVAVIWYTASVKYVDTFDYTLSSYINRYEVGSAPMSIDCDESGNFYIICGRSGNSEYKKYLKLTENLTVVWTKNITNNTSAMGRFVNYLNGRVYFVYIDSSGLYKFIIVDILTGAIVQTYSLPTTYANIISHDSKYVYLTGSYQKTVNFSDTNEASFSAFGTHTVSGFAGASTYSDMCQLLGNVYIYYDSAGGGGGGVVCIDFATRTRLWYLVFNTNGMPKISITPGRPGAFLSDF